jgi:hypothetical protein
MHEPLLGAAAPWLLWHLRVLLASMGLGSIQQQVLNQTAKDTAMTNCNQKHLQECLSTF